MTDELPPALVGIERREGCWRVRLEQGDLFILYDSGELQRERTTKQGKVSKLTITPSVVGGDDLDLDKLKDYGVLMQSPPQPVDARVPAEEGLRKPRPKSSSRRKRGAKTKGS